MWIISSRPLETQHSALCSIDMMGMVVGSHIQFIESWKTQIQDFLAR
jgi:hypothetical protein